MRHALFNFLFSVLRALRVPRILQRILDQQRIEDCRERSVGSERTRFGPYARVLNSPARRDRIRLGKGTLVDGELLVHDYGGAIEIGENSYVGLGSRVWSGESVKIGSFVLIAHNVNITDTNSHQFNAEERREFYLRTVVRHLPFVKGSIKTAPVIIEDHAWINFGVGILKGVRVGRGAVIAAHSLVTKDVPPYSLVAGSPARVIRQLDPADHARP